MSKVRIVPRLDIKGNNLVKGIHLEGLRIIGDPQEYAVKYYNEGADEILYVDIVASLYGRSNLAEIVKKTAQNISVPLMVAGGIRSIDDIRKLLRAGADKVCINTAAINNPGFITESAKVFGSQCIVVAIDIKRWPDLSFLSRRNETVSRGRVNALESCDDSFFQVYTDNGRQQTGLEAFQWIMKAVELGAGEIMVTSIDNEGTMSGFETDFIKKISESVSVPVIAGGGAGSNNHIKEVIRKGNVQAVAIASILHYNKITLGEIKSYLSKCGIKVANYFGDNQYVKCSSD